MNNAQSMERIHIRLQRLQSQLLWGTSGAQAVVIPMDIMYLCSKKQLHNKLTFYRKTKNFKKQNFEIFFLFFFSCENITSRKLKGHGTLHFFSMIMASGHTRGCSANYLNDATSRKSKEELQWSLMTRYNQPRCHKLKVLYLYNHVIYIPNIPY